MDRERDDFFLELGYRLVASVDLDEAQHNLNRLAAWTSQQQQLVTAERLSLN